MTATIEIDAKLAKAAALIGGSSRRSAQARTFCRRKAGVSRDNTTVPVVVVEGDAAPTLEGEGYHFTTPGGRPVYHPNAYRAAWGKVVYHASTLRVVVGAKWVLARC